MAKLRHHQDLAIQTVAAAHEKQQKVARFEFSAKHNLHKARKRADIVAKKNRFENRRTRTLKRLAMKATDKAEILAEEAKDQAQLNGLAGPHLAKGAKHDKEEDPQDAPDEPQDAPDEPQDAPEAEEEKPEAEKAEDMAPPAGGKGSEEEDGVAAAQEKAQEAEIEKLKAEKKQAEQASEIEKLKNEVKKAKEEKAAPEIKDENEGKSADEIKQAVAEKTGLEPAGQPEAEKLPADAPKEEKEQAAERDEAREKADKGTTEIAKQIAQTEKDIEKVK